MSAIQVQTYVIAGGRRDLCDTCARRVSARLAQPPQQGELDGDGRRISYCDSCSPEVGGRSWTEPPSSREGPR